MLAPGNSMQADLHTPRFPYVLIIYFLPVLMFARFVPLPSAVFSYVQTSNKPCSCLRAAHFIEE